MQVLFTTLYANLKVSYAPQSIGQTGFRLSDPVVIRNAKEVL